jgi:hypothetical protein
VIIQIGPDRRLRSYRYGWIIEQRQQKEKTGEFYYKEDSPAFPASLAQAFEMVLERIFKESGDCDISEVPARLQAACRALKEYAEKARRAA